MESDGVPKTIEVDNASAFKSADFARYSVNLVFKFFTPNVHTPIGFLERNIQTVENYVKTYLLENNDLKTAVKRAIRTIRFFGA